MARADELKRLLHMAAGYNDRNPAGSNVDGLEHALRMATLAKRNDPMNPEMVFTALVHYLARPLSEPFYGEVISEIVRDLIDEEYFWVLRTQEEYHLHYVIGNGNGGDLDTTTPWHRSSLLLNRWRAGSYSDFWRGRTMPLHQAEWYIDKICGGIL